MREGTPVGHDHAPANVPRHLASRRTESAWSSQLARFARRHIVALLAVWGALFGLGTFFYKDVFQPRTAPVNISLSLELKKISPANPPPDSSSAGLIAVEMQLGATNPSSREIFLLPNVWIAYGYRTTKAAETPAFSHELNAVFGTGRLRPIERFTSTSPPVALAGGNLLSDTILKPGEKVARKLVFHVPRNTYDVVEVWTAIPTAAKADRLLMTWRMEDNEMIPDVRYNDKNRSPLKRVGKGQFVDEKLELQQSGSRVALSLWE